MNKFLTAVLLSLFAAVTVSPVAIAQDKKDEKMEKKADAKKAGAKKADAKKDDAKKDDAKKDEKK